MTTRDRQWIGTVVFGTVFIAFLMTAFALKKGDLEPWQAQLVAVFSSLLAGLFGFFLTGTLSLDGNLSFWSGVGVRAGGGAALFLVTMLYFRSPASPVRDTQRVFRDRLDISTTSSDVHGSSVKPQDQYEVLVTEGVPYEQPIKEVKIGQDEVVSDVHWELVDHIGDICDFNTLKVEPDQRAGLRLKVWPRKVQGQGFYLSIRIYGTVRNK